MHWRTVVSLFGLCGLYFGLAALSGWFVGRWIKDDAKVVLLCTGAGVAVAIVLLIAGLVQLIPWRPE